MDPPAVSVVVPTRGRAAYLEVTLDSLLGQRAGIAHEILVVDDGDDDAIADAVRARPSVRYVRHGTRRGLNAARNIGLREAGAPLIAFVDDDVLIPPGWLAAIVEGAERHPERRGVRRADPGPLRGAPAARLRPRGSADHHARPGRRGPRGRVRLGRQLRGAP